MWTWAGRSGRATPGGTWPCRGGVRPDPEVAAPTRQEALETLREGHERLASLLDQLSGDDLRRPRTIGGGDWSAIDLVDHLALWEQLALQSLSEWREGRRPMIEDVFGQEGGVDRLNDANVGRNRQHGPAVVRA